MKIDDDGSLHCPYCDYANLHHERIEVYERGWEDDVASRCVVVQGNNVTDGVTSSKQNPSDRRNGIRIVFSCEGCIGTPSLTIVQHKGCTYIEWEKENAQANPNSNC